MLIFGFCLLICRCFWVLFLGFVFRVNLQLLSIDFSIFFFNIFLIIFLINLNLFLVLICIFLDFFLLILSF
jgi:hypothetical protein